MVFHGVFHSVLMQLSLSLNLRTRHLPPPVRRVHHVNYYGTTHANNLAKLELTLNECVARKEDLRTG